MLGISRAGLAMLLLNLTLVGWEPACAHESQVERVSAHTDHAGSPAHHADSAPDRDEEPCDRDPSRCCDAIASCTIAGIAEQADRDFRADFPESAVTTLADAHFANAPLEVAT